MFHFDFQNEYVVTFTSLKKCVYSFCRQKFIQECTSAMIIFIDEYGTIYVDTHTCFIVYVEKHNYL